MKNNKKGSTFSSTRPITLRARLFWVIVVIVGLAMSLDDMVEHFTLTRFQSEYHFKNQAREVTATLAQTLSQLLHHGKDDDPQRLLYGAGSFEGMVRLASADDHGTIHHANYRENLNRPLTEVFPEIPGRLMSEAREQQRLQIHIDHEGQRIYAIAPVNWPGGDGIRPYHTGLLVTEYDISPFVQQALMEIISPANIGRWLISILILLIPLFWMFEHYLLSPLRRLEKACLQLSHGQLSTRMEIESDDEIGRLGSRFNEMASRLQELVQRVAASDAHSRQILDTANDAILITQKDGLLLYANPAARRIFRLSDDEWRKYFLQDLVPPSDLGHLAHELPSYDSQGQFIQEVSAVRSDGEAFRAEISLQPMSENRTLIFVRDVTERHERQQALERERQQTKTILEGIETCVFIKDASYRYLYVNPATRQLFNVDEKQIIGSSDDQLFDAETFRRIRAIDRRVIEGGETVRDEEFVYRHRDGEIRYYWMIKSPLRDSNGKIYALCGLANDITERRASLMELKQHRQQLEQLVEERTRSLEEATEELREQTHDLQLSRAHLTAERDRFYHYLNTVNAIIVVLDPHGLVTLINRKGCELLGLSEDQIVGRDWFEKFLPHPLEARLHHSQIFNSQDEINLAPLSYTEGPIRTAQGETRLIAWHNSFLHNAEGQIVATLSAGEDITQRRTMEEELRDAQKRAEAANLAKGQFLANMSHEIRTPMNAILGFSYLLEGTSLSPKQQEFARKISTSAHHLLVIINDILDFSRVDSGKLELHPRDFNLQQVLDSVLVMVGASAQSKHIQLTIDVSPEIPPIVHGDPTRIGQVLINLAGNAVKFTDEGQVKVSCLPVPSFNSRQDTTWVRFEIMDTGPGLTEEQQSRLFTPFEQLDGSTTRRFGGTGLGLAISSQIIALMGGQIGVKSEPGQGATFWFEIPLKTSSAAPLVSSPRAPDGRYDFTGKRVLIVEDNPVNLTLVRELLKGCGILTDTAENGAIAVDRVRDTSYDLILMDMQMPVMDGIAATYTLRQMDNGAHVPILAMTANAFESDRQRCLAIGMNDHIAKPVAPEKLYDTLAQWLTPGRTATPESAKAERQSSVASTSSMANTTSPHINHVVKQLQDSGKIDTQQGLHMVGGNPSLYERLLRQYASTHQSTAAELMSALESGDSDAIYRASHALKGMAGTLGAYELQIRAEKLNTALRQGQPLTELLEEFTAMKDAHVAFLNIIRRVFP